MEKDKCPSQKPEYVCAEFTKQAILALLDMAINLARRHCAAGNQHAYFYLDALQEVRTSISTDPLPKEETDDKT